jgi:hypothetical protein
MASNFSCLSHETKDSIHLILYGDFDGDSAHQLINALKSNGNGALNVFIDTNDLFIGLGLVCLKKKLERYPKSTIT